MPDQNDEQDQKERRYNRSIDEQDREHSFKLEDERWERQNQIGDWLKLALLILISLAYHLLVFFLEPGLR